MANRWCRAYTKSRCDSENNSPKRANLGSKLNPSLHFHTNKITSQRGSSSWWFESTECFFLSLLCTAHLSPKKFQDHFHFFNEKSQIFKINSPKNCPSKIQPKWMNFQKEIPHEMKLIELKSQRNYRFHVNNFLKFSPHLVHFQFSNLLPFIAINAPKTIGKPTKVRVLIFCTTLCPGAESG